jgi:hypothetical protein
MKLSTTTPNAGKPDLSEHEEESVSLDDVLKRLLSAKPAPKPEAPSEADKEE